jgi:hypothetical protein
VFSDIDNLKTAVTKEGTYKLCIRSSFILNDVFAKYKSDGDFILSSSNFEVEYEETGKVELIHEYFTMFWRNLFDEAFDGEDAKVPKRFRNVTHAEDGVRWKLVGTILSHYLLTTKEIPNAFCRSTLLSVINPDEQIPDCVLLNDLFLHLTTPSRRLLKQAMTNYDSLCESQIDEILDVFCHCGLNERPDGK